MYLITTEKSIATGDNIIANEILTTMLSLVGGIEVGHGRYIRIIIIISFDCSRVKVRPFSLTPHTIMIMKVMMTPLTLATLNLQTLMVPMIGHSNMK